MAKCVTTLRDSPHQFTNKAVEVFSAIAMLVISLMCAPTASAQSAQYCAGVCGGTIGYQNVTPNPTVERCFQRCLDGDRAVAPNADKNQRKEKKSQ
jgi:hypothetical protein